MNSNIPGGPAEASPADPTTTEPTRSAPACRTPATLTPSALAALAAGGTDPAPVNPTTLTVRALQALAALLHSYGDMHEGEALLPYIREGWITGANDATARALVRAHMAGEVSEFDARDWRTTTDGRICREVWGIFEGVRIQATQRGAVQVCVHCAGSGLAGKTAVACGDCGGAS